MVLLSEIGDMRDNLADFDIGILAVDLGNKLVDLGGSPVGPTATV